MIDLFYRACLHPLDYIGALKKRRLIFKEKIQESGTIYSFIFEPTETLVWKAGQHAIFTFPKQKLTGRSWRPFSVASSPHEKVVRIGTIISEPHSDFKQKLFDLKPGNAIFMNGPFGEFYVKPRIKHIIGFAGGIGITPFRSILSHLTHQGSPIHITLIYSAKDHHTYRREMDEWQATNDKLNIIYTRTPDEVNGAIDALTDTHKNNADYFISGSPGMINAIRQALKQKGIKKIHNDPFKGY